MLVQAIAQAPDAVVIVDAFTEVDITGSWSSLLPCWHEPFQPLEQAGLGTFPQSSDHLGGRPAASDQSHCLTGVYTHEVVVAAVLGSCQLRGCSNVASQLGSRWPRSR